MSDQSGTSEIDYKARVKELEEENRALRKKNREAKRKPEREPQPVHAGRAGVLSREFEGLTNEDCCDDCNVEGCVISQMNYCAHPRKGSGLQSVSLRDPIAVRRYSRAKTYLRKEAARS